MLVLRMFLFIVSAYSASISPFASVLSPDLAQSVQEGKHSERVSRSMHQRVANFASKRSKITNVRKRAKRQFFFPGYYNPYNSFGNYYYPSYPGFYNSYYYPSYSYFNPLGTGSLWAAGGGLLGNTLSFFIGK